jgi:hypothetical protein
MTPWPQTFLTFSQPHTTCEITRNVRACHKLIFFATLMIIWISIDELWLLNYSAILFFHKNPDLISEKIDKEVESCSKCLVDNQLSLHLGRTDLILLGPKCKLKKNKDFNTKFNSQINQTTITCKIVRHIYWPTFIWWSNCQLYLKKVNSRSKFMYMKTKRMS